MTTLHTYSYIVNTLFQDVQ